MRDGMGWMKSGIAAAVGFAVIFLFTAPSLAGDWQWGCMGPISDQHVVFSRDTLVITSAKPPLGDLEDLFRIAELPEKFLNADDYDVDASTGGLQKTMHYTDRGDDKNKLTLTETSSKTLAHKHHLVCGRDEDNWTTRRTYHVMRTGQPPADVTLMCREYMLTTRGGRPCVSN